MPISLRGSFLTAIVLSAGLPAVSHAETLAEALTMAYEQNPTLQAQRATQRALDETYVQARAGWRPTLSTTASASYEELRIPRVALRAGERTRAHGNFGALSVSLNQPLWTGGRVASAVSAANADVLSGRENLRRIEASVMQAVIQAYVDVRRDQEALRIQQESAGVLRRQLEESQARFDVGEVTRTDVALSQARLAQSSALVSTARAQLAISRASYAAVVGQNPGELTPEPSLGALMPVTVDEAFDVAEANNPTLRAQQYAEQASRARVAGARADRMPNVSLQSVARFTGGTTDPFVEELYRRDVTTSVNVTVPLFAGGVTSSRVRQAIERNNADRISVENQRRGVLQSITQAWNQVTATRANIESTAEQVRAARIAAEGTRQEEQVGLRTTIDVLNAEQELRLAELNQITARRDEYVASALLLNTMGRLEGRNLVPSAPQYDAARNFRNLRITWGWVPWEEGIGLIDRTVAFPPVPQPKKLPREPAIGQGLTAAPADPKPAQSPPAR